MTEIDLDFEEFLQSLLGLACYVFKYNAIF